MHQGILGYTLHNRTQVWFMHKRMMIDAVAVLLPVVR